VVPGSYALEFRRRVVGLVRGGRSVSVVASEVGVSEATVYRWRAQDRVDRGEGAVGGVECGAGRARAGPTEDSGVGDRL
jgi:transposase-like protein